MDRKGNEASWSPTVKTRSGRTVHVTGKAAILLAEKAEKEFWKSVRELQKFGGILQDMIQTCQDPKVFKDYLVTWMSLYNEVKEAEGDMFKFVPPSRLKDLQKDKVRVHEECMVIKNDAYRHLQNLTFDMQKELQSPRQEKVFVPPYMHSSSIPKKINVTGTVDPSKSQEINRQIDELQDTIQNLENEIANLTTHGTELKTRSDPKNGPHISSGGKVGGVYEKHAQGSSPIHPTIPVRHALSEPQGLPPTRHFPVSVTAVPIGNGQSTFNFTHEDKLHEKVPEHSTPVPPKRVRILAKKKSPLRSPPRRSPRKLSRTQRGSPRRRYSLLGDQSDAPSRLPEYMFKEMQQSLNDEHLSFNLSDREVQEDMLAWAALRAKYCTPPNAEVPIFNAEVPSGMKPNPLLRVAANSYIPSVNTPPEMMNSQGHCYNPHNPPHYDVRENEVPRVPLNARDSGVQVTESEFTEHESVYGTAPLYQGISSHASNSNVSERTERVYHRNVPKTSLQSGVQSTYVPRPPVPQPQPQPMMSQNPLHYPPPVERKLDATVISDADTQYTKHLAYALMKLTDHLEKSSNSKDKKDKDDKVKLPTLEPSVFQGDAFEFNIWLNSFVTLVESRIDDPVRRLFYLSKYVSGPARKAIKELLDLNGDESAYDKAIAKLKERYGSPMEIAESFRKKLRNWPNIKDGDHKGLMAYADFLSHCHTATRTVTFLSNLSDSDENSKLAAKLPSDTAGRWNRKVVSKLYPSDENDTPSYPTFREFCDFVQREALIANGPCAQKSTKSDKKNVASLNTAVDSQKGPSPATGAIPKSSKFSKGNKGKKKTSDSNGGNKSSFTGTKDKEKEKDKLKTNSEPYCLYCTDKHYIENCPGFLSITPSERKDYCRSNAICFGCMRKDHDFKSCRHRNNPLLTIVVNDTNTSFQGESGENDNHAVTSNILHCDLHNTSSDSEYFPSMVAHAVKLTPKSHHYSWVVPVQMSHVNKPSLQYLVYALIDTQSDGCFISSEVMHNLGLSGVPIELDVTTMVDKKKVDSTSVQGITVKGVYSTNVITLPVCFERESIPTNRDSIARMEVIKAWPHLRSVVPYLLPYDESIPIGLLIGYNCPRAAFPHETYKINTSVPWATLTDLGWSVTGPAVLPDTVPFYDSSDVSLTHTKPSLTCHNVKVKEKDVSFEQLRKAFDLDFLGSDTDKKVSYEDTLFLRRMDDGFRITEAGHVEIPLPVREDAEIPSGSRKMAYRRLMSQKKVLIENEKQLEAYKTFFTKMFEQHQAEPAPPLEVGDKFVWYLPHMVVYHPRKPDKPRVVFDGSATVDGVSLNDLLMSGPDMANNLIGVLLRFREDLIAFQCDIQGMFHQVMVTPKWRNMLRFFWFKDHDPRKPVVEYRVTVHLFGATSSPACATYALRKVAEKYLEEYGEDITSFILKYFYVDDGLRSVATAQHALDLILGSHELCSLGGFRLHEFCTNSAEVLQAIPADIRSKILKDWSDGKDLPDSIALGVHWSMQLDYFYFLLKALEFPLTRRGLLSAVGTLYDPLGMLAPILLKGRLILQELCHSKLSWDTLIPENMQNQWNEWYTGLKVLENLKIARCYKKNVLDVESSELHMFCDACDDGYGACSYLVLEDEHKNRDVTLVLGKARVKPLKKTTTPRLELQAAVLSTRMAEFLLSELPKYPNMVVYMWTDSMIVLAYITNSGTRYRVYVANRVQTIRDKTTADQWGYVSTLENPADIASRGCLATELVGNSLWFEGPTFLKSTVKKDTRSYELPEDDPEVYKEKVVLSTKILCNKTGLNILDCLNRHSSWNKMIRTTLVWRKLSRSMFNKAFNKKGIYLSERSAVEERHQAKLRIIQLIQKEEFPVESCNLESGYPDARKECKKRDAGIRSDSRNLRKLDVYLCEEEGVLKVGGRIQRADIPLQQIHPIILPNKNPITEKIIRHYHESTAHVGRYSTMHLLRSFGFWITNIRSAVDHVIRNCVVCKKSRGKILEQKMSNLPCDRLEIAPPFTYCGVDYFGPFYIKIKRSVVKRWACLFTCLVVRAIHIELCDSMTTDSFIMAYRRFVSRRGPIRSLRCDRGSNIMGSRSELDIAYSKLDQTQITRILNEEDCDWITFLPNAPKASHMGGVWERMIGSVRKVLDVLLRSHGEQLCDEGLRTLVAETEAIVNNRPLTYVDISDPANPQAISPSTLLTTKLKRLLPPMPGKSVKEDLHIAKMWKRVQFLSDLFWTKWKHDYLPYLNERVKWHKKNPNLQRDDIVLLVDDNLPRSSWPMGRVVDTKISEDGLVRSLTVRTQDGVYDRPIKKIVFLYRKDT